MVNIVSLGKFIIQNAGSCAVSKVARLCRRRSKLASFMKKCEIASKEKKLAGAAKSSFSKKCVKDAVGA